LRGLDYRGSTPNILTAMGKMNGANGKQKQPARVKVQNQSADVLAEQVEKLKELFPEATSEGDTRLDDLKPLNLTRDMALDDETTANQDLQCRLRMI